MAPQSLSGRVKYSGVRKFAIFDRNIPVSRKRHDIGSWSLRITNRKSLVADRPVSFQWPWVTSKGWAWRVKFLRRISITLVSVWSTATKFGMVAHVGGRACFYGSAAQHPKRNCLSVPPSFGTYMRAHGMRNSNQILLGDQTGWGYNFYTVDHAVSGQNFCDTNADTRFVCDR